MAISTSGCWWLRQAPPAKERPTLAVAGRGLSRLGVVTFGDATQQQQGARVAQAFREELTARAGGELIRAEALEEPPTGARAIGFIGVSQAQQLGRLNRVDGLLSGQVLAYHYQRGLGRVWVSVSLRLLEANRGTIIKSLSATGTAPVRSSQDIATSFDVATHLAAKEFVHDLLGSPP